MTPMTHEELVDAYHKMMSNFADFKRLVKSSDKHLFERWKAGGFIVDEDIVSMYPNATQVFESFECETVDEDEDEYEDIDDDGYDNY